VETSLSWSPRTSFSYALHSPRDTVTTPHRSATPAHARAGGGQRVLPGGKHGDGDGGVRQGRRALHAVHPRREQGERAVCVPWPLPTLSPLCATTPCMRRPGLRHLPEKPNSRHGPHSHGHPLRLSKPYEAFPVEQRSQAEQILSTCYTNIAQCLLKVIITCTLAAPHCRWYLWCSSNMEPQHVNEYVNEKAVGCSRNVAERLTFPRCVFGSLTCSRTRPVRFYVKRGPEEPLHHRPRKAWDETC